MVANDDAERYRTGSRRWTLGLGLESICHRLPEVLLELPGLRATPRLATPAHHQVAESGILWRLRRAGCSQHAA